MFCGVFSGRAIEIDTFNMKKVICLHRTVPAIVDLSYNCFVFEEYYIVQ